MGVKQTFPKGLSHKAGPDIPFQVGDRAKGLSHKVGSDIPFQVGDRAKGLSHKALESLFNQGSALFD